MSYFWRCTAGWLTYLQTEKGVGSAGRQQEADDEMGATPQGSGDEGGGEEGGGE